MHMERVIAVFIVLMVVLLSHFKYGSLEVLSSIRATSAASTAMSLPIAPIATPTSAVLRAGASLVVIYCLFGSALVFEMKTI